MKKESLPFSRSVSVRGRCFDMELEGKVGPCLGERAEALLWSLGLHPS